MSCGMAAVPRMTSVGREPLILSRVRSKGFWLLYPNLMYHSSFPTPPHPLNTEHLVFLLLIYAYKKLHYMIPHIHTGWECFHYALAETTESRQKLLCLQSSTSAALIHLRSPVDYLWVSPSGPSAPLVFPQIKDSHLLHWMIPKLSLVFLGILTGKHKWTGKAHTTDGLCQKGTTF